jgi:hypothetical protein
MNKCFPRFLRIAALFLIPLLLSTTAHAANLVTILCDQPKLVVGEQLHVVRHDTPRPRQNTRWLLKAAPRFDRLGKCEVRLDDGSYRFEILAKRDSTFVALSSGLTKIESDLQMTIKTGKPVTVRLRHKARELAIEQVTFRVQGTLTQLKWSKPIDSDSKGPEVILSPGQDFPVRVLARGPARTGKAGRVHVVMWMPLQASRSHLDLSRHTAWLGSSRFEWSGKKTELEGIKNATARLYLPEGDELDVPIESDTTFITNRRFVEMSYSYETAAGERLEFNRRSHRLKPRHSIDWGGPLTAAAYARVTMKWAKPGRSLLWGAYLHNAAGDVVSRNEFPPEKPHRRTSSGHPTYLDFRQSFSGGAWKQTLHRVDGGPVPADPENLTQRDLDKIGDVNRMHENYLVAVSCVLDGKKFERNVPLSRFVTWKSKRASIETPASWGGRPAAYLDKVERIHAICQPLGRYTPDFLQMFWTNNYGAGYTVGPRSNKRIQMGFFDLRDRKGLHSLPDILIHEVLHAFGYRHGRPHDEAIRKARRIFKQHQIFLADHPDYVPEPVTVDGSIEDTRNFGAENHGKFARIKIPRDEPGRRGDLGPFRGHEPKVESQREALSEVLALKSVAPLPAKWDGALDLLTSVDPGKDAVRGKWTRPDGQLLSQEKPYARVQLSAAPRGSYQLEVQFTRVQGDCLAVMLPVGASGVSLIVSGWNGKVSGLAFVGGKDADRNKTKRDGALSNREKHTLLVTVQLLEDDQARIKVTLDAKDYMSWKGARSALKPDRQWSLPRAGSLGIGAYDAVIVVHGVQLKMLGRAE